jgi:hypothetical protein
LGKGILGGNNSIDSNSLRGRNFCTKILTADVITLTEYKSQVSKFYCKTLDVTNEKPILIARFSKKREALKWEKIHSRLIHRIH